MGRRGVVRGDKSLWVTGSPRGTKRNGAGDNTNTTEVVPLRRGPLCEGRQKGGRDRRVAKKFGEKDRQTAPTLDYQKEKRHL